MTLIAFFISELLFDSAETRGPKATLLLSTHVVNAFLNFCFRHCELSRLSLKMRRAQSNRGYSKTTHPTGTIDDMGALRETAEPESIEDGLRKQALDMDRENDKVGAVLRDLS